MRMYGHYCSMCHRYHSHPGCGKLLRSEEHNRINAEICGECHGTGLLMGDFRLDEFEVAVYLARREWEKE